MYYVPKIPFNSVQMYCANEPAMHTHLENPFLTPIPSILDALSPSAIVIIPVNIQMNDKLIRYIPQLAYLCHFIPVVHVSLFGLLSVATHLVPIENSRLI